MNKNCIAMVAIQEETSKYNHKEYFEISKLCWESYCKKHNIDFILIDKKLPNVKFCVWHKEFVFDFIEDKYEKIALVDFDTMVHWNAPNFFELYNDEFCGAIGGLFHETRINSKRHSMCALRRTMWEG